MSCRKATRELDDDDDEDEDKEDVALSDDDDFIDDRSESEIMREAEEEQKQAPDEVAEPMEMMENNGAEPKADDPMSVVDLPGEED